MIRSPAGFSGEIRNKRYTDYYQAGYGPAAINPIDFTSPLSLFATGAQGAWYDPSDFSTMFQDDAGTTPVTAVEQTVGLILDKSGRGNNASQATLISRPVLSARVNLLLATATLATQSVTTVATNYTLAFSGAGSITLSGTATGVYTEGSYTVACTAGTLTLTVSGSVTSADLRVTNIGVGLPTYQRVTTATDYDTAGFPYYLRFDGSNDWLQTAAINTGSVDRVQVFAGARKLSDAGASIFVELSASHVANAGTFSMLPSSSTSGSAGDRFAFSSRGSAAAAISQLAYSVSTPAPATRVWTATSNISGDLNSVRLNGAASGVNATGDQGTGNYLSYPLYIGRRGGTTLPFNGYLYGLIIRFSTIITPAQIASTESWLNNKTKAY